MLFNVKSKKEAMRHCKRLTVYPKEFSSIMLAAQENVFSPYLYSCHFFEGEPTHLIPKQDEISALNNNGLGILQKKSKKAVSKIFQLMTERKLLAVHLFYTPSKKYWHMFYFNQRDVDLYKNHWTHGPHVHYSNDTFTKMPLNIIWGNACSEKPSFPNSLHIRYAYGR